MIKREDVAFFSFLSLTLAVLITLTAGCAGSLPAKQVTVIQHELECHDTKDASKMVPCSKAKAAEQEAKEDAKEDKEDAADEAKASKPTPAKAAPAKAPTTPAAKSAAPTPANDADEEATKGDLVQLEKRTDRKIGAVKEIALDAIKVEQLRRQKEKREAAQATAAPKANTRLGAANEIRCEFSEELAGGKLVMRSGYQVLIENNSRAGIMASLNHQPIVDVNGASIGVLPGGAIRTCVPKVGSYVIRVTRAMWHPASGWRPVVNQADYATVYTKHKTWTDQQIRNFNELPIEYPRGFLDGIL
jgi:hypothetical protein